MGKTVTGRTDLKALREAYERGESQRSLARRFGIGKTTVVLWAKRYGWERREPAAEAPEREKLLGELARAEAEAGPRDPADYEELRETAKLILAKARQQLSLDGLTASDLKNLSASLKDLRALLGALSPREAEESDMRLAALRRQAERDGGDDRRVEVVFVGRTKEAAQ